MSTPPLTLGRIADELKLSRVTVSSVINGKTRERRISEATASRVNALLIRRGYVPSRQAVKLRSQSRDTVGILHTGHLYSHLIEAFNRLAGHYSTQAGGIEIMLVSPERALAGLRELIGRRIQSLIWIQTSPSQIGHMDPEILFGLLSNVTTVLYNHEFEHPSFDRECVRRRIYLVGADRRGGFATLAARLFALGHRWVALPDIAPSQIENGPEAKGPIPYFVNLVNTFEARGIRALAMRSCEIEEASAEEMGRRAADAILEARHRYPITAACFRDDEVCAFAMMRLMARGVRIPDDLSVTGMDDLTLAPAFRIGLTTLRIPVAGMVQRTIHLLARTPAVFRHQLEVPLVERQSLAQVPARGQPSLPRREFSP